jgi:hypothetical protein
VWKTWWAPDADIPIQWFSEAIASDSGLLLFVEAVLRRGYRHAITDVVGEVQYSVDLKWAGEFADVDQVKGRLAALDASTLTDDQRLAVQTFLRAKPGDERDPE